MLIRILVGLGLAAAGYYVGREIGRRETRRDESTIAPESGAEPDPNAVPGERAGEHGDTG